MDDKEVSNQTQGIFGGVSDRTCIFMNTTEQGYQFSCVELNPWFAILTLLFIYLPSVNVIATLYGPKTAGKVAMFEGPFLLVLGGTMAGLANNHSYTAGMIGWFLIFLGAAMFLLGCYNSTMGDDGLILNLIPNKYLFIFFLPLIFFSPVIFVFIKLLAILKPNNEFIQSQSVYGSRGEAILEAAPQMILQLYGVLLTMNPSMNQTFSIITSAATLSLPNIENFVSARGGIFGFQAIIKNILVFLPACLFKVLTISIICVFFSGWIALFIFCIVILMSVCVLTVIRCYNLPYFKDKEQTAGKRCDKYQT